MVTERSMIKEAHVAKVRHVRFSLSEGTALRLTGRDFIWVDMDTAVDIGLISKEQKAMKTKQLDAWLNENVEGKAFLKIALER